MLTLRTIGLLSLFAVAPVGASAAAADAIPPAPDPIACPGGYANTFRLGGAVRNPKTFTLAELQSRPTSKITVSWYSGRDGLVTETYIGVPLLDLITEAEVILDPGQRNDILRQFIVGTASDCYQTTIALAEILPQFGGEQVIVAFADGDGVPLGPDEGMARLVIPSSKAGGRNIFNLSRILVRSPGPGPQSAAAK